MAQEHVWENEYRDSQLLAKNNEPQKDTLRFLKFLKKQTLPQGQGKKFDISKSKVLDIGSGTGRNSNHAALLGASVIGLEISETAIKIAKEEADRKNLKPTFYKHDIGSPYPFDDNTFDIALDVVSSNSLGEDEREIYIREIHRVLKPEGFLFVKALCKDGDDNAKNLLKTNPGLEKDTYQMPGLDLVERVWTQKDFEDFYKRFFEILFLEKKTNYARMNNRSYKRNYWICYMRKLVVSSL